MCYMFYCVYIPIIFCYIFKLQFHPTSPPSLFHSYIAICEHKNKITKRYDQQAPQIGIEILW